MQYENALEDFLNFIKELQLLTPRAMFLELQKPGYISQDVNQILTKLVYAAGTNPMPASIGIVCIDEFDKISSGKNAAVFSGQGTTKDVTGIAVQRELLKRIALFVKNREIQWKTQ